VHDRSDHRHRRRRRRREAQEGDKPPSWPALQETERNRELCARRSGKTLCQCKQACKGTVIEQLDAPWLELHEGNMGGRTTKGYRAEQGEALRDEL